MNSPSTGSGRTIRRTIDLSKLMGHPAEIDDGAVSSDKMFDAGGNREAHIQIPWLIKNAVDVLSTVCCGFHASVYPY